MRDREPRKLRPDQEEAKRLAKQAVRNLDLRLQLSKTRSLNESVNLLLSVVSHDVRAPLCSMVSIHDMLRRKNFAARAPQRAHQNARRDRPNSFGDADELLELYN